MPRGVGTLPASLGSMRCTVTSCRPSPTTSASWRLVPGFSLNRCWARSRSNVQVHDSEPCPTNDASTVQGPAWGNSMLYRPSASVVTPSRRWSFTKTAAPGRGVPWVSWTSPVRKKPWAQAPAEVARASQPARRMRQRWDIIACANRQISTLGGTAPKPQDSEGSRGALAPRSPLAGPGPRAHSKTSTGRRVRLH